MIFFIFSLFFSVNSLRIWESEQAQLLGKKVKAFTFEDTTFNQNDDAFTPTSSGEYHINRCNFINNVGQDDSAGSITATNNANIYIEDCNFTSNSSPENGGAIYSDVPVIDIKRTRFINNVCNNTLDDIKQMAHGGAIHFKKKGGNQTISNCVFQGNKAKTSGGAIYVQFEKNTEGSGFKNSLNIIECQFTGCESGAYGGAICSGFPYFVEEQFDGDMAIEDCTFSRCNSEYGGAVYFAEGTVEGDEQKFVFKCTFEDNLASKKGSSIYSKTYELTLDNSTFKKNKRQSSSGLIPSFLYIEMNEKPPTINNVIFEDNSGSTINIQLTKTVTDSLDFTFCTFRDYTIGPIFQPSEIDSKSTTNFLNCTFTKCHSEGTNLPIVLDSNKFNFQHCFFTYNTHGTVRISDSTTATFEDCDFNFNTIDKNGAAIYISTATEEIKINNCRFSDNTASEENGGSIYANGNLNVSITKCEFTRNKANKNGGGLYLNVTQFILEDCIFKDNK